MNEVLEKRVAVLEARVKELEARLAEGAPMPIDVRLDLSGPAGAEITPAHPA